MRFSYIALILACFAPALINALPAEESSIYIRDNNSTVDETNTYVAAQLAGGGKKKNVFTNAYINQARVQYPQYNWVICHPKHSIQFDGVQGTDWGHQHEEFDVEIGGTYGYEIYWFLSGTFTLEGKANPDNWAYDGNLKSIGPDGKELVFEDPKNPLPPVNESGSPLGMPMAKGFFHFVPALLIIYFCAAWF